GISCLTSYRGAQIFEAVGIGPEVMDRCFAGTASRLKGASFRDLGEEAFRRHEQAWATTPDVRFRQLANPGEYHWRAGGEKRMWNPNAVAAVRHTAETGSREAYRDFARMANES